MAPEAWPFSDYKPVDPFTRERYNKRMKFGGRPIGSPPRGTGAKGMIYSDPEDDYKEDNVAHGGDKPKKKPTANLDKAKQRFRTAAWWCFGIAAGLIGGKIYVDLGIYFGMPAQIPVGPMKVWAMSVWIAAVALYVFLYSALWVAATSIRRKLKVNTAYDVTMGDVRIVKVSPEMQTLIAYAPEVEEQPLQIEATAEAIQATVTKEM